MIDGRGNCDDLRLRLCYGFVLCEPTCRKRKRNDNRTPENHFAILALEGGRSCGERVSDGVGQAISLLYNHTFDFALFRIPFLKYQETHCHRRKSALSAAAG